MSLSSLIVQREVATMRQVEEALARQVIYGGDLVTNLLEVAHIDEAVLTRLLAESMQLPAAPVGELRRPEDEVRALVPPEVAVERSIVPLSVSAGRLVLAVAEPMSRDLQEQLTFNLGMAVEQRAASTVRVRQAIARTYGLPLDRRVERLLGRMSGKPAASLGSMPPPLGAAPKVTEPPRPLAEAAERAGRATPAFGTGAIPLVRKVGVPSVVPHKVTSAGFPAASGASGASEGQAPQAGGPPAAGGGRELSGRLLERPVSASARVSRRRRGPLTLETAKQEADDATHRDALLDLFFDFSRQFFDYAALFLVQGDIAEGRESFGAGAARERVLGMGVPLDLPSMLSSVRDKKATVVTRVSGDGLEAVLLADLQRPRDVDVAFVPLVVRTRAVAILIGDCGVVGIDRATVGQVTSFAVHVGKAFERIIVRRKLDGFIAGAKGAVAGKVDAGAVAQKRAVSPTVSTAPPPPPGDASPGRVSFHAPPAAPVPSVPPAPAPATVPPPKASLRPGPNTAPPPSANIAVLRKISGPPIPREDPETPARGTRAMRGSTPPPPDVVVLPPQREREDSAPQIEATPISESSDDFRTLFDELAWETRVEAVPPPPPSSAVAVAPHLPPTPQRLETPLPSVVVDLEEDLARLVDRVVGPEPDDQAEGELLRQGEKAMPVVMARFPGPVNMDRSRIATMARPPRASDCGPVLRLVARERKVALPFVLERLTDGDPEARGWATHLLCELAYPEAIPYLLLRLREHDPATRMSAALALAVIGRGSPREVRDGVLGLAHGVDPRERAAAMFAMAELRQPALVPELVRALGDGDEEVVAAAHAALVQVTRQDFGADARPWLKWWEQNAARHRVEWLIDALTHEISEIRRWAGEELRSVTKEYFGYASDLPPRDRERAKQRYRDWWLTEGKARFAKAPPG
jgi:hypothetical protein